MKVAQTFFESHVPGVAPSGDGAAEQRLRISEAADDGLHE